MERKPADLIFSAGPGTGGRKRQGRGRRVLLVGAAILLIVVLMVAAAVPAVISSAPVRRAVVARLNAAQQEATLTLEGWSWRWFGPCRIDGLVMRRKDQSASLSISSITLSKGLATWLGTRQDFGVITVDSPALSIMELRPESPGEAGSLLPAPPPGTAPSGATPAKPHETGGQRPPAFALPVNPFGELVVRNGKAEAFPLEGPAIRIADIGATLSLSGLKGPVAAAFGCGVPRRQGQDPGTAETIQVEASTAILQDALLAPASVPFEARITVPPVDLASLDAFLPPSASRPRIRDGLAELHLVARRGGAEPGVDINGTLDVRRLHLTDGVLGADAVQWREARVAVDLRRGADSLVLRDCRLESPWVNAKASGTLALSVGTTQGGALSAEGQVDLAAVAAQIPRTLRIKEGVFLKEGVLKFEAEALAKPDGTRLFGMFRCEGLDAVREGRPVRVDFPFSLGVDARLAPSGEARHATLHLTSPAVKLTLAGHPAEGTASGEANLGALTETLETLFALNRNQRAAGRITLEGGWNASDGTVALNATLLGERLLLAGTSDKPLELSSARISAEGTLVKATASDAGQKLRNLSVEASTPFAKLKASVATAEPSTSRFQGIQASFEGQMASLLAMAGGKPEDAFAETVTLAMAGDLDADTLTLRSFRAASGPFDVSGKGSLAELKGERLLAVEGLSKIDLDGLQAILKKRELDGVTVGGRSERPFRLSVPLGGGRRYLLSTSDVDAGVLAQRLAGLGMSAQDTEVSVNAAKGELRLAARSTVNEGQLRIEPVVDLLAEPPLLTLPKDAPLLTDAKLTNEMLDQQLARIHPIFKGCSVSSGKVSISMADCAIPVASNALQRMTWTASLLLQDVRLAPAGPLEQAASALRLRQREVVLTNQTITVSCRNGRLHPQPLTLLLGGYGVRVSGSVGLDGSLDYGVELPLTVELLGEQAFRYMGGQTLRIPLVGTATNPRLDLSALEVEVRRLATAAATRAATDALREKIQGKTGADSIKEQIQERAPGLDLKKLDPGKIEDVLKQLRR